MSAIAVPPPFVPVRNLGAVVRVYTSNPVTRRVNGLVSLVLIVIPLVKVIDELTAPTGSLFFAGLYALILFAGFWSAWYTFSHWWDSAVLYADGFAFGNRTGTRAFLWDEVDSVTAHIVRRTLWGLIPLGTERFYTIRNRAGESVRLENSITRVEELYQAIRDKVLPLIEPRLMQAYHAGEPVTFGRVVVQRDEGIAIGEQRYAWDDLDTAAIEKNLFVLRSKGKYPRRARIGTGNVPNLDVLVKIVSAEQAKR